MPYCLPSPLESDFQCSHAFTASSNFLRIRLRQTQASTPQLSSFLHTTPSASSVLTGTLSLRLFTHAPSRTRLSRIPHTYAHAYPAPLWLIHHTIYTDVYHLPVSFTNSPHAASSRMIHCVRSCLLALLGIRWPCPRRTLAQKARYNISTWPKILDCKSFYFRSRNRMGCIGFVHPTLFSREALRCSSLPDASTANIPGVCPTS